MSPKSGRCLNGGISVPQQVMGHVDCTVVTDMPAVGTGLALNTSVRESYRLSIFLRPLTQSRLVRTGSTRH